MAANTSGSPLKSYAFAVQTAQVNPVLEDNVRMCINRIGGQLMALPHLVEKSCKGLRRNASVL